MDEQKRSEVLAFFWFIISALTLFAPTLATGRVVAWAGGETLPASSCFPIRKRIASSFSQCTMTNAPDVRAALIAARPQSVLAVVRVENGTFIRLLPTHN